MSNDDRESLAQLIDRLLRERRPDRYTENGSDDDEAGPDATWLREIAEEIEPLIVEADAVKQVALTLVMQVEKRTTRRANTVLRDFSRTGQLGMFWAEDGDFPIAVITRKYEEGQKPKTIQERVALRAATADDLRAWAVEERRRAAKDFAARNEACTGAEDIAESMTEEGSVYWIDWAPRHAE
jgi:hypothetical protein